MAAEEEILSYPILTPKEIEECLRQAGINFPVSSLTKPVAEEIKFVYEKFLEIIMNITPEACRNAFSAMSHDHPEIFTDAIADARMFTYLQEMMRAATIHDFSIKDLSNPTSKRATRVISALVNFAKFREEQLQRYQDVSGALDDLLDKKELLTEEKQTIEADLLRIKRQRAAEEPQTRELEGHIEVAKAELSEMNIEQRDLSTAIGGVKEEIAAVVDKTKNVQYQILEARQETERLRSQIIENPEALKRQIAELEAAVSENRESLASERTHEKQVAQRAAAVAEAKENVESLLNVATEVLAVKNRVTSVQKELAGVRDATKKQSELIEKRTNDAKISKRGLTQAHEKHDRVLKAAASKQEASEKRLQMVLEERRQLEEQSAATAAQISANEANIAKLKANIEDLKAAHEKEIQEMEACYSVLAGQVKGYHAQMYEIMSASSGIHA